MVLDRDVGESWRLEHPSMQPEPDKVVHKIAFTQTFSRKNMKLKKPMLQISMTVAGQSFQIDSAVNGLALTPDGERLFYSALGLYKYCFL